MKRTLLISALAVVTGLAIGVFARKAIKAQGEMEDANWTIEFRETSVQVETGAIRTRHHLVARDPDRVAYLTLEDDGTFGREAIWNKDGILQIDHKHGLKSTIYQTCHLRKGPMAPLCGPSQSEKTGFTSEYLGEAQFLGTKVHRWRLTEPNAVVEVWKAPACGCRTLYQHAVDYIPNTRTVYTTFQDVATALSFEKPNPALFDVPARYVEGPPSAMVQRSVDEGKSDPAVLTAKGTLKLDQRYYDGLENQATK